MAISIEFLNSSFLRLEPKQIKDLPTTEIWSIGQGQKVGVKAYKQEIGMFLRVTFDRTFNGRNTWLVYAPDIRLDGTEPDNKPKDQNATANKMSGAVIRLPGFSSRFYASQPIIPNGHFTWGEATHGGTRQVENADVVDGILRIAKALEEVRTKLGDRPMHINSWYRDPATNRAVGGASQSRHMWGDAVDFVVDGIHPYDVYDKLDGWWGDRGGLASATVFTHLDARGYAARWNYGF
jgi:Peptidase M15